MKNHANLLSKTYPCLDTFFHRNLDYTGTESEPHLVCLPARTPRQTTGAMTFASSYQWITQLQKSASAQTNQLLTRAKLVVSVQLVKIRIMPPLEIPSRGQE